MVTERAQPRRVDLPDMSADMIAARRFGQSWRGYDQEEVRQFLADVAVQVRAWKERYESAEAARREAEQRAAHPQLDEATLTSALGQETAEILRSAHSAAAEILSKAETSSERLVSEAQAKADEILKKAESVLAERTTEAEAVAAKIIEEARKQAEEMRSEAVRQHDSILADLARKRRLGTVQIEQLRAGREKLLEAYMAVRRTLDEVTSELQRADSEARAASQAVARHYGADSGEDISTADDELWAPLAPTEATSAVPASGGKAPVGPGTVAHRPAEQAAGADATPAQTRAPAQARKEARPASSPASETAPVVRAPKVAQLTGARPSPAGAEDEPLTERAAEFESVRIVRDPAPAGAAGGKPAAEQATDSEGAASASEEAGAPAGGKPADELGAASEEAAGRGFVAGRAADSADSEGAASAGERARESEGAASAGERARESEGAASAGEQATDSEGAASSGEEAGAPAGEVENLFARIRASRAEATNKAKRALGTDAVGEGGEQAPTPPMGTPAAGAEQVLFAQREEVFNRLESSLVRKLKRALQDEQNDLLDRLRNVKGPVEPAKVLPGPEEHPDRFVDASKPLLEEAAHAGSSASAAAIGLPAGSQQLQPGALEDLADELGRTVAEPLRQRLEEALRSDGEPSEVAEAISAAYREWKTQRIEAAARDQLAAAFARGAYLGLPEGTRVRWVVDPSEGPCPDCEDNTLAQAQPRGEPWPTGQLHPPAHPGCRCALVPEGEPEPVAMSAAPAGRARSARRSAQAG